MNTYSDPQIQYARILQSCLLWMPTPTIIWIEKYMESCKACSPRYESDFLVSIQNFSIQPEVDSPDQAKSGVLDSGT